MKLTRLLLPNAIAIPLEAKTKDETLQKLVHLVVESHGLTDEAGILEKVMTREKKMSTGIGYGVAVPHAKCDQVQDIKIAIGISQQGIAFEAIDDELVYIVFLMISPSNTAGPHIQTLSAISRIMSYDEMRTRVRQAKNAEEFLAVLAKGEAKYL